LAQINADAKKIVHRQIKSILCQGQERNRSQFDI